MTGSLLSSGQRIALTYSGVTCRVDGVLGVGGQGEVYRVVAEGTGATTPSLFAFKGYLPRAATKEQYEALRTLVDLGPPSERFLWPSDIAELSDKHSFGYLMALRDERFVGLSELVRRRVTTTFGALLNAGFQLADSYLALHTRGLCYRDISLGNVFFDPATGDVLICDNDNVSVDGEGHESVLGTSGFMAPEVERMDTLPSTNTDLYSLSVLLFLLFVNHHPLLGARELEFASLDQRAMRSLYGVDPVFIFDPEDERNRPVPGVHDNAIVLWPLYPSAFQRLFVQAFSKGLYDPEQGRVRESTWKAGVARLRDLLMRCGCGAELFFDDERGVIAGAVPNVCWSCKGRPPLPLRLRIGNRSVTMSDERVLYAHHTGGALYDYRTPVATVTRHPLDPRVQGLRNLTDEVWEAVEPDGMVHRVGRGRSVRLAEGIEIRFAGATAVVEGANEKNDVQEGETGW